MNWYPMQPRKNTPVKEGDVTMLTGDLLRVRVKDITPEHVQQRKKYNLFDVNISSDDENTSDISTRTKNKAKNCLQND